MRRILAVAATIFALAGTPAAASTATTSHAQGTPAAAIAKTCGTGYRRATIGGATKCLRRGQYCSRRYRGQYPKYGYQCRPDASGVWRLR
jgi:hypothetical protein